MVARLGGDEFAVILDDVSKTEDTTLVAEKILTEFKKPHDLGKEQRIVSTSIGIVVDGCYSKNPDSIIKKADLAMYKAKDKGKSTYCLYAASCMLSYLGRVGYVFCIIDLQAFILILTIPIQEKLQCSMVN